MEPTEQLWGLAQRSAKHFLRRYDDPLTRRERADLVQECATTAWRWAANATEPQRFPAAVRTIAKRARYRMLATEHRRREMHQEAMRRREETPPSFRVRNRVVPGTWLLAQLQQVVADLAPLDRHLLLGNHEGFCVAELAERYGTSLPRAKTRLHRARRRVRRELEAAVVHCGHFDELPETPVLPRRNR
jgi:RNA polymerase sigma factor (sigma-70 family)